MKRFFAIFLFIFLAAPLFGQTSKTGQIMTGLAATKPTSCNPSDVFVTVDTYIVYVCGPINIWTTVGAETPDLWSNTTSYKVGDIVSYLGNTYTSIANSNSGHVPLSQYNGGTYNSLLYWQSTLPFPPPLMSSLANGPTVQYVSQNGNDSNDGRSWGTAKATWDAACESLYTGNPNSGGVHYCGIGTIHIMNGIQACPASSGYGIQLMGNSGDPNYPYNGTCWEMLQGSVTTVCDGAQSSISNGATGCLINGGSNADIWHPGLWMTGSDVSVEWDGVQFQGQGRNVLISVCSDETEQSGGGCGVGDVTFNGVQTSVDTGSGSGPGWCIDTNTLWVHVYGFSISGNAYNATGGDTADAAAAVLMGSCIPSVANPSATNGGMGSVTFDGGITIAGGIKIWSGDQGDASATVCNLTTENRNEAMVWFAGPLSGDWKVCNINYPYDPDGGNTYTVRADAGVIPVVDSAGKFSGLVELFGNSSATGTLGNPTIIPTDTNIFGYISPFKFRAQSDAAAREFPAVMALGVPLMSNFTTAGNTTLCGTCTLTTGIADPAGGTNAAQISDTGAGDESDQHTIMSSATTGDTFVFSAWINVLTGNCCTNGGPILMRMTSAGNTCQGGATFMSLAPYSNSNSWQHYIGTCTITSFSAPSSNPEIGYNTSSVTTLQIFNPQFFLLHGYAADEVAEMVLNLGTWAYPCSSGQLCNINGSVYGGAFSTQTSTYTLKVSDSWINVTGSTTVKAPHLVAGQTWNVFNSGSGTVTLEADSGNFNGTTSVSLSANTGMTVTCDGTNCFGH